jgi:thermostable 8-oxoguanine DNA glycosylase
MAAYGAVMKAGLLDPAADPTAEELEECLSQPLTIARRAIRYRYPRQRARYLAKALHQLKENSPPISPVLLRAYLLQLAGIGPKTSAWIVRNYTGTDSVAIIDIHVWRAGMAAGFISPRWRLPLDYAQCEVAYLAFASAGGVSASLLDSCIWSQLHELGRHGLPLLAAAYRSRLSAEDCACPATPPKASAPKSWIAGPFRSARASRPLVPMMHEARPASVATR